MIEGKSVIAVIPARGGSKRVPRKNLQDVGGRPLIVHSIRAAQSCNYIDKIVVSSDDSEILRIADDNGCEGERREARLSQDRTSTIDVLKCLLTRIPQFDIVATLQPTSPMRTAEHICAALRLYCEKNADAVISVCRAEHPPQWMSRLDESLSMEGFVSSAAKNLRSQDLGDYFRLNGAIYCNNTARVLNSDSLLFETNSYAYIMNSRDSVDIDTYEDLEYARYLMSKLRTSD